ncbi:MAG: acyl-CoA dehydratase activase [Planctomycetota bacterium]|jgi:predicted CoA-substrate-specific enzyme activase
MDKRAEQSETTTGGAKKRSTERLRDRHKLYIGVDIGSASSDVVVLDESGNTIFNDYQRTKGRPIETAQSQLTKAFSQVNLSDAILVAATGSAGRFFADLLHIPFINEVPAQATAIWHLYPKLHGATIIEMGGQDTKLIFLSKERGRIRDFELNTVCAAGTGSFLDQQAQRLGIDIEEEFGQLALQSKSVPRMAGRCSVFAKSDMIHLQQQATPNCDIIAGLCLALARNLKGNIGCGREFIKPIIFTGGVAANMGVVRALEQVLGLVKGELVVPKLHFFTGAIGAVLVAKSRISQTGDGDRIQLEKIDEYLTRRTSAIEDAPRREQLGQPSLPYPNSPVYEQLLLERTKPIGAYLGVDVGSISTNVAVIDEQKHVLTKAYLMTAGKPLEAVCQGLDIVGKKVAGKVKILGAATTGSGRYLTGDFIGADIVINEITAQATGAAIVNPKVDTIFEIGGQDSKYISLENGVVVDFAMNHACAAGTGSFLEEQAQRLDININEEFAELAFKSEAPIKLGERCTVFMESDLLSYQQQGGETKDLVAGLSYSIVANYLNRVVGRRRVGSNICFQGGTAFNKSVCSAFEKVTGRPIMVPDHHEVTGAIGAAAIAASYMESKAAEKDEPVESNFRGFESLVSINYTVESFTCEHCPNHCEVKKVQLPSAEPLYYGSRCDRYNLKKKKQKTEGFSAFEYRQQKLLELAGLDGVESGDKQAVKSTSRVPMAEPTVGFPMALINWQLLPLFARFFKSLGFEVVLSGRTDKRVIRRGVESVNAQPCFPVKVAYGHIMELIDKGLDYIFLPSIVSMTASFPHNEHNQLCPFVQSLSYQAKTAFGDKLGRTKILSVPIRMGEGDKLLRKSFAALGRKLNVSAFAVRKAIEEGLSAQAALKQALVEKGREILSRIGPEQKLFVLISRPYNGCDEGLNLQLPRKLAELGAETIPMDMLALDGAHLSDESLHRLVYWSYGQKILRAAEIIKDDPRLFAIYLSNFNCGPDSFLLTFFKDIMGEKPSLQLELDEHSADAGVITRLEAFLESLKHYRYREVEKRPERKEAAPVGISRQRTLYIPYMGDCAYGMAACFKAHGQPAEVMPLADEAALLQGRAFTSGKECLPCAITSGDMLKVIRAEGFDPAKAAFFMPAASGPCRFGMYSCLHRLILRYAGAEDVPVIAPNQDSGFYRQLAEGIDGSARGNFMKDAWVSVVGLDLLRKVILQLRPFAKDVQQARQIYEQSVRRWTQAIENHRSLSDMRQLMADIADEFAEVKLDRKVQKPRIGIVGEIYVRSHPFANMDVIARLEQLGAVCDLASLAEWIYYTNFTRGWMAKRRGRVRDWFTNVLQNFMQHRIEKALAEPLERRFGSLAEGPIEHVIELAEPYLHRSFEGEAILSIGKTIEYHHQGFGGVVNVMPFSCMPSTVVSTQTMRISAECGDMPILNLSFDGQEDATLITRLEAFVEQIRQRQGASVRVAEIITA